MSGWGFAGSSSSVVCLFQKPELDSRAVAVGNLTGIGTMMPVASGGAAMMILVRTHTA